MSGWWRVIFILSCFLLGYAFARRAPPGSSILGFREVTRDMLWLKVGRWMITAPISIKGQYLVLVWPFVKRFNSTASRK
jgi:hypothetical protein